MTPPRLDAEALSRSLFASNTRIMELEAEVERLRAELLRVEPILVAADRVHEAYEAMLDGRHPGRLPDWEPSA